MYFRKKRKIPEINSSSSADVAFLLLIFFLLTASLNKTEGIFRNLPSATSKEVNIKKENILKRNLLTLSIDGNNQILMDQQIIDISELKSITKNFIDNPDNKENFPEKIEEEYPLTGKVYATKNHIIALYISENASYETYISVLNKLIESNNELRDDFSKKTLGKSFKNLNYEQKDIVRKIYPQRISEIRVKEDVL